MQKLTTKIDPEIADHIDTLIPSLEKEAGSEPVKRTLVGLYDLEPDKILGLYLDDQLNAWLKKQVRASKAKPEKPEPEVTMTIIKNYVSKRYPRYLEYAEFHTKVAHLSEQAGDVLHEVLIDLLLKNEQQLYGLYNKVKGSLRELDFYILRMIKLNCHSKTSPYRYRHRQPLIDANAETPGLHDHDNEAEAYMAARAYQEDLETGNDSKELVSLKFQMLRDILTGPEFTDFERNLFSWKFFLENPWKAWTGAETIDHVKRAYIIIKNKLIRGIQQKREERDLQAIHQVFTAAKFMQVRISERDFLLLRKYLADLKARDPQAAKLEKRLFLNLNEMIADYDVKILKI